MSWGIPLTADLISSELGLVHAGLMLCYVCYLSELGLITADLILSEVGLAKADLMLSELGLVTADLILFEVSPVTADLISSELGLGNEMQTRFYLSCVLSLQT